MDAPTYTWAIITPSSSYAYRWYIALCRIATGDAIHERLVRNQTDLDATLDEWGYRPLKWQSENDGIWYSHMVRTQHERTEEGNTTPEG